MKTKIIEGTNGFNWGKFLVGQYNSEEWAKRSEIDGSLLLRGRGWSEDHIWVMDLQTGEGLCVRHGGMAVADLNKHKVWVCPMFEPFLIWLYKQKIDDIDSLPSLVQLEGESSLAGYRRAGERI